MKKEKTSNVCTQKTKFDEYLKFPKSELYSGDYKLLETAFAVQCSSMVTLANRLYPNKIFTEEDAAECVLMAFNNRYNTSQKTFLYNLLSSIYDEIALDENIPHPVLAVIRNDWCIITVEDPLSFNNTDECLLSGALDI